MSILSRFIPARLMPVLSRSYCHAPHSHSPLAQEKVSNVTRRVLQEGGNKDPSPPLSASQIFDLTIDMQLLAVFERGGTFNGVTKKDFEKADPAFYNAWKQELEEAAKILNP